MNAPHLHLIVNHSPLFAELAALLLLAAGAALRKRDLVTAALAAAVLAGPLAAAAFFSGRATAEVIGRTEGVDQEAIGPHEEAAEAFAVVAVLAAIAAGAALRWPRATPAAALGIIAALGAGTWTAERGGFIHHREIRATSLRAIVQPQKFTGPKRRVMESSLEIGFMRVSEKAAIAAARTMGYGKRKYSDQVAVEAMREELNKLKMRGTVVIGEGERDKAPMLYVGEPLGRGWTEGEIYPEIDIAVDPLEGTNLCATGSANSIAVLAASEKGGLLNAPDVYMDKIVVGPTAADFVSLGSSVQENLNRIADAFKRDVDELTVIVLDRERHHDLIAQIREAGARIKLITDGDLSAGIAAAVRGTGIHAAMGIGGAPEGVLTAAAMRCLNGRMQGRLKPLEKWQEERLKSMGFHDGSKIYDTGELASGNDIIFCATGVTDGDLLRGVRFFGGGIRTSSLFMSLKTNTIRFVDTIYREEGSKLAVSFA
jgi:fructose-1,6-bisphosphatase class II